MAGVDAVIARGYIDEQRLYVSGCSGGALTTWVIGQSTRFAAAAALCPVTDWISMAAKVKNRPATARRPASRTLHPYPGWWRRTGEAGRGARIHS